MREVKIGICLLIGLLLVMPVILAIDTEVNIKTMPYRDVQLGATINGQSLSNLLEKADEYGDASFVFNFTSNNYDLFIFIKEEGTTIVKDKQLGLVTGDSQYFEVAISGFEFIETPNTPKTTEITNTNETSETNETSSGETEAEETDTPEEITETPEETIETEEIESNSSLSKIAGAVVSKVKENKSFVIYGVLGVVVIGGMIFLLIKHRSSGEIKIGNISGKANADANRQEILDVEDKLKQIQDKLDSLG